MALSFVAEITKKGNIKLTPDVLEILGVDCGDRVRVTIDTEDVPYCDGCPYIGSCPDHCGSAPEVSGSVLIPASIFEEAELDINSTLEMYAVDRAVIIQEAEDD